MNSPMHAAARGAIVDVERALYRAMIEKDFGALGEILAPDLVYVHSTAVAETRDEYLAGVAAGRYEYESIGSRDPRIRIDGNTAIIDGVVDMRVGETGQPKEMLHLLFALVWMKQGGRWRLYHRQATRIRS